MENEVYLWYDRDDKVPERVETFKNLLKNSKQYKITEDKSKAKINIFFDSTFSENETSYLDSLEKLLEFNDKIILIDLTRENLFEDTNLGGVSTILSACASYLTCDTPEMQEIIYTAVGRTAMIVHTPIDIKDCIVNIKVDNKHLNNQKGSKKFRIGWFGSLEDVFSIFKIAPKLNKKYDFCLGLKDVKLDKYFNKNKRVYKTFDCSSEESLNAFINYCDVIVLPYTHKQGSLFETWLDVNLKGKFAILCKSDEVLEEVEEVYTLYKDNPKLIEKLIKEAQDTVVNTYSTKFNAKNLRDAITFAIEDNGLYTYDSFVTEL